MLRARASAERGERAGEPHSAGLVCWCRLPRDPVQPVLISDGGSKLRKNFFVVDNFSEERKNSKSLKKSKVNFSSMWRYYVLKNSHSQRKETRQGCIIQSEKIAQHRVL
jgi:hypothetical protein